MAATWSTARLCVSPSRSAPRDAAYLSRRYRTEFEILAAPAPVRRLVFPAIVAVGTLLGLHRWFADAPEPM
jgi:hypothetical protein